MSANDLSVQRFVSRRCVAGAVGSACIAFAFAFASAGCSAGSGGDSPESRVVTEPEAAQLPTAPAGPGVTPMPSGSEVIFAPDEVPMQNPAAAAGVGLRRGLVGKQVSCSGGATTSVSGTVYIPSGELPLYNATVYVPDAALSPLPPGPSCSCEINGAPIASTLTDASGHFVLENVPVGDNVPLVIQVGDWRREFDIGTVSACVDTPIADRTLKLPARRSEGDLPKIAVATGILDALECLVLKLGIDPSEFTNPIDGGSVHLFSGYRGTQRYAPDLNPGGLFPPAEALWWDAESLSEYDIVLLSCEGDRSGYLENKSEQAFQGMFDYANLGGRIFASHFHGIWLKRGPAPFPELAVFTDEGDSEYDQLDARVVTTFPKGRALAEWLVSTGISADGVVPIEGGAHTIVNEHPEYAQRWIESADPASVQYISANTPLGAPDGEQCGRIVLSDIHVSPGDDGDDISDPTINFPNGCVSSGLSPQEAVLAFMLFDLSACVIPDSEAPVAPPTIR